MIKQIQDSIPVISISAGVQYSYNIPLGHCITGIRLRQGQVTNQIIEFYHEKISNIFKGKDVGSFTPVNSGGIWNGGSDIVYALPLGYAADTLISGSDMPVGPLMAGIRIEGYKLSDPKAPRVAVGPDVTSSPAKNIRKYSMGAYGSLITGFTFQANVPASYYNEYGTWPRGITEVRGMDFLPYIKMLTTPSESIKCCTKEYMDDMLCNQLWGVATQNCEADIAAYKATLPPVIVNTATTNTTATNNTTATTNTTATNNTTTNTTATTIDINSKTTEQITIAIIILIVIAILITSGLVYRKYQKDKVGNMPYVQQVRV